MNVALDFNFGYKIILVKFDYMIAVELSLQQLKKAVKGLSPIEKLELNELIWSSDAVIPEEHQRLVNERIKKADGNAQELLDWDIAAKSLRF